MSRFSISSRRVFLAGAASLPILSACGNQSDIIEELANARNAEQRLAMIEAETGGRIGVSAVNLATGETISHRGEERFAMCSTFKWLLGALVLKQAQAGVLDMDRPVEITQADMVAYAPVTEPAIGSSLTLAELCKATIQTSDNPAANILLRELGGPDAFTAMLRADGEEVTRLDRWEPELNENAPGDERDTTTPHAMVSLMGFYLFGTGLSPDYQMVLKDWMIGTTTGLKRLRAGIGKDWIAGDKTGTASANQSNDVAFAFKTTAPGDPVLMVSYLNVENPMSAETDARHADIARLIMRAIG